MLLLLLSVLAKRMKSPPSLLLYWGSSFVSQTSSLKKGVSCHVAISFWTGVWVHRGVVVPLLLHK